MKTLWMCSKCSKALCELDKGAFSGATCMLRFHSDSFFGLAKSDAKMHDGQWRPSNLNKVKRHASYMRSLVDTMAESDEIMLANVNGVGVVNVAGV
jgi:hypothetical protein